MSTGFPYFLSPDAREMDELRGKAIWAIVFGALLVVLGLLAVGHPVVTTVTTAWFAGLLLLAIGVACWLARNDERSAAQVGLLTGVLLYDVGAAALLAWAALGPGLTGTALWPAVVLHTGLAVWSLLCLCAGPAGPGGA
jgi:uncharacterized membrane protein HdeD (DUF308 family)